MKLKIKAKPTNYSPLCEFKTGERTAARHFVANKLGNKFLPLDASGMEFPKRVNSLRSFFLIS
jgi:hypothetical protein